MIFAWFLPPLLALTSSDRLSVSDLKTLGADDPTIGLVKALEKDGFPVHWTQPPHWGDYGLLDIKTRSVWINPVVFDLGIAQPTLAHEATHAAQMCAAEKVQKHPQSIEDLTPLGLGITPSPLVRPYILRYSDSKRRQLELEAYALQAEPDRIDRAIALLRQYCQ